MTTVDYNNFFGNTSTIPNFGLFLEQSVNPHKNSTLRVPFYLTSSFRRSRNIKGVAMQVNPSSVTFRQDKRITERDTQEGKVFFHWATQNGTNDDVIRIDFSGQTGNISLKAGTRGKGFFGASKAANAAGSWLSKTLSDMSGNENNWEDPGTLRVEDANIDTSGASRLANFHNLLSLTREPVLDPVIGVPVYYYITYASPLFGNSLITFVGHFSRPLEFTDDAGEPFNKRYSFGFVAHGSYPSPSQLYNTILNNLSQTFINAVQG